MNCNTNQINTIMKKVYLLFLGIIISNLTFSQFSNIRFNDVFSTDSLNAWVVGDSGVILKVANGGQSIEDFSYNTHLALSSICFTNPQKGFIVGQSGLVLQTNDGGMSWNPIDLGDNRSFRSVSFVDDLNGWISTHGSQGPGLYRTTNGGEDWNYIDSTVYNPCFIDQNNGWAAVDLESGYPIQITNDGGISWSTLKHHNSRNGVIDLQFIDLTTGLFTTSDWTGEALLYKTIDGGDNWTVEHDIYGNSISIVDIDNCWIGGIGIYYSSDFYESWEVAVIYHTYILSLSVHGQSNGWAVGYDIGNATGAILKLDGINNWYPINLVGFNEITESKTEFSFYPNPTNNLITISYDLSNSNDAQITITNIRGQEIKQIDLGNVKTGKLDLNCEEYSSGVYFISLKTGSGVLTKKLIIE